MILTIKMGKRRATTIKSVFLKANLEDRRIYLEEQKHLIRCSAVR
jgi:hypothetical protein